MTARWRPAATAVLALLLAPMAHAQISPAPTSTVSNKRCDAAEKRIARKNRDLATTLDALGRERKARETCTSRSGCTRIDEAIAALEKRHHRHQVRLVRARADALDVCKAPTR